jgi:L-alanine-DL-glutamate epimerase-like enolase superfamily enzyme
MSGSGLGYLDVAHFASCIPNPAPFHEFKGNADVPMESTTSSLLVSSGMVRVPSGPGFGITIDPSYVREAKKVTAI